MDIVAGKEASPKCAGMPTELFFGPDGEVGQPGESPAEKALREAQARQVCMSCPLRSACLESELQWPIGEQWGIRGGMTAEQRREVLQQRRLAGEYAPSRTSRINVGAWESVEQVLVQSVDRIVGAA